MAKLTLKYGTNQTYTINVSDLNHAALYKNLLEQILTQLSQTFDNNAMRAFIATPTFIQGFADYIDDIVKTYADLDYGNWEDSQEKGKASLKTLNNYYQERISSGNKSSSSFFNFGFLNTFYAKPDLTAKYAAYMLKTFPNLNDLLTKTANNFLQATSLALTRISNDSENLMRVFFPNEDPTKIYLSRIIPTGSDMHKQGEQVLILEFSKEGQPIGKVVYKPSSVLVDMMLVGDTTALYNQLPPSDPLKQAGLEPNTSAAEIINQHLNDSQAVSKYMVFPREQANVAKSYGYLEYLSHEPWSSVDLEEKLSKEVQNPNAKPSVVAEQIVKNHRKKEREEVFKNNTPSDYIVDSKQEAVQFAVKAGRLAALSMIFGASDRHIENLIVSKKTPYLIDFENSLLPEFYLENLGFTEIESGSLLGNTQAPATHRYMDNRSGILTLSFKVEEKNRLYYRDNDRLKAFDVKNFTEEFMAGFTEVMNALNNKTFESWLKNPLTSQMVVRVLPFETTHFRNNLKALIRSDFTPSAMEDIIYEALQGSTVQQRENDREFSPVVYFDAATHEELSSYNIPVFYMKVTENQLLNARGQPLDISDPKALSAMKNLQQDPPEENPHELAVTSTDLKEFSTRYYLISPLQNIQAHIEKMVQDPKHYIDQMAEKVESSPGAKLHFG